MLYPLSYRPAQENCHEMLPQMRVSGNPGES